VRFPTQRRWVGTLGVIVALSGLLSTITFIDLAGASSSGPTQMVTTTTLGSSLNPSVYGQSVTFTATVTGIAPLAGLSPTGIVTFYDGASPIGSGSVTTAGVVTLNTSTLSVGSHSVIAKYGADSYYGASGSGALSQVVDSSTGSTTTTLTSTSIVVLVTRTARLMGSAPVVPLQVTCGNGACSGSVQLSGIHRGRNRSGKIVITRSTSVVLARATFNLATGMSGLLILQPTPAGVRVFTLMEKSLLRSTSKVDFNKGWDGSTPHGDSLVAWVTVSGNVANQHNYIGKVTLIK
jgi:hypothetical protein